jgi:hypothetical protein
MVIRILYVLRVFVFVAVVNVALCCCWSKFCLVSVLYRSSFLSFSILYSWPDFPCGFSCFADASCLLHFWFGSAVPLGCFVSFLHESACQDKVPVLSLPFAKSALQSLPCERARRQGLSPSTHIAAPTCSL